jgi:PAS domain S-box-containing protein
MLGVQGSAGEAAALLRALSACSPAGIFLADTRGRIVETTPHFETTWGTTAEVALGMGWIQMVHPDDRDGVATRWATAMADGIPFSQEFRLQSADGPERWVHLRSAPVLIPGNAIESHVGTVEDISQRRRAEEDHRAQGERFQAQYRSIPIPTYTWQVSGDDWILVDYNDAALEITRGAIRASVGVLASEFFAYEPELLKDFAVCTQGRQTVRREMTHRLGTTGEVRELVVHYAFVEPNLVMIHTEDVSARRQAERRHKELEQQKNDFLSAVAHDLKTPLTSLKGYSQLLSRRLQRDGVLQGEQAATYLQRIEETSNNMSDLIAELMDVTRLHMGESLDLVLGPVDLVALAREVAETCVEPDDTHTLYFEATVPSLIGPWDRVRLERIITNLVSNAVTYTPEGGPIDVSVLKETEESAHVAVLRITDTGIGVPEAELPHIFERFYRASNVTGTFTGTGIGLWGARHIAEQHGGTLSATSKEGAGSTFTLRLPLKD